ncbi:MAG: hypothetical protein K1W30_15195 [Lachnospiraceae bacterium]
MAFNGDTILVPRKENKNVVVIFQNEYEELQRAKRNAEYLAMLNRGYADIAQGRGITILK